MDRHRHGPPQTWNATEQDRSEIGPYLGGSLGFILGFFDKLSLTGAPPRWGDFSESAVSAGMELHRHGPTQRRTTADMERL